MGIIGHAQKMVINEALSAWEEIITPLLVQKQLKYLKNNSRLILYLPNNRFFWFSHRFSLIGLVKEEGSEFSLGAALFIQLVKEYERSKRKCTVSWLRTPTLWRVGLAFN